MDAKHDPARDSAYHRAVIVAAAKTCERRSIEALGEGFAQAKRCARLEQLSRISGDDVVGQIAELLIQEGLVTVAQLAEVESNERAKPGSN